MQVAVYSCMKLQMIRAKASQGAGRKHRAVERQALLGKKHSSGKTCATVWRLRV